MADLTEPEVCKNKILVVDGAHNLRTKVTYDRRTGKVKQGKLSATMLKCAAKAFKVIVLTATPVVNEPYDIANLIAMVDGEREAEGKADFKHILADPRDMKGYEDPKARIDTNI